METKKIYFKNGVLTNEYFINEESLNELASNLGIDPILKSKFKDYIKEKACHLIESAGRYTISIDGKEYSGAEITFLLGGLAPEEVELKPKKSKVKEEPVLEESENEESK